MSFHTESADSPQQIIATVKTSTEVEVSWEEVPAIDQNGIITFYEVKYVTLQTFGGLLVIETVNTTGPDMGTTLTGLQEYMEYNISVRAYTSVGSGPYSDPVTERTLEDGECPQSKRNIHFK